VVVLLLLVLMVVLLPGSTLVYSQLLQVLLCHQAPAPIGNRHTILI